MKSKYRLWLVLGLLVLVASISVNIILMRGATGTTMTPDSVSHVPAATREQGTVAEKSDAKPMYTCPMHPQIVQDHPGDCPLCGMDLVPAKTPAKTPAKVAAPAEAGAVKYQCPMHPTIIADHPSDCPLCGMKLVKMDAATGGTGGNVGDVDKRAAVTIDPARQQLIGLRTAAAVESEIRGGWKTVGRVAVDPTRVSAVNLKVGGYVEQVFADFVGKPVEAGTPLYSLYSPELFAAQQEYLLARKSRETLLKNGGTQEDGDALVETVRQKLRLWDVSSPQIRALEESGKAQRTLTFTAPASGVVTAKNIVAGSSVMPGEIAFEITDLSTVWVLADAYQADLARLETGTAATFTAQGLPGKSFKGQLDFIDPVLDPMSRTLKVRVTVANPTGELRPDIFGEVTFAGEAHTALVIPADAVIPTGQEHFVFVAAGDGRFEPRRVQLGARDEHGHVEVTSGLMAGEEVVTRANFLIDSESSLRAALAAVGS